MSSGHQRRTAGIAANLSAAGANQPDYEQAARMALAECMRSGEPFTADDIHRRIPASVRPDRTHNVVPSLLGVCASAGEIRRVGAANSTRPSRHGSRNQVWIAVADTEEKHTMTEFNPGPGEPGAAITVVRPDGQAVEGQIQFPHPQGSSWVWVSLWDGRQPVAVQFSKHDRTVGYEGGRRG